MSKLHVNQIAGFITKSMEGHIDMTDYSHHKAGDQQKKAFLTRGLAALAVSKESEVAIVDLGASVTDGSKDGGIDLIHFNAAERTLYLAQTKWHDDGHGSMELGDVLKFIEGVKKILDNNLTGLNSKVQSKAADIEKALFDASAKFVLVLAHTGLEDFSEEVSEALNEYVNAQNDTSELMFLKVLKQGDLHKAVATGFAGIPVSAEVQLYGWGQVREPHYAVYGQVCADDVASWMRDNGARLFDRNLRQFLGTSAVNQDIVDTIINRADDFWYFNNGITAIASELGKKPIGGSSQESAIFECTGFCVVNGAQTVGSIFAASTLDPDAVSKAMVPIRIISSGHSSESFALEVTRFTNTQNAIEKRDFVALDPEQERIRQELQIEGVEYSYKSGAAKSDAGKRFDLTEATIALACSGDDVSLAVQAKREIGKLWEDLNKAPYKKLFNSTVTGPSVWESVKVMRMIEGCLTEIASNYVGRDKLICVHGNRFIAWISFKRLGYDKRSEFTGSLDHVLATVSKVVDDLIAVVKINFIDSYPASLFKNQSKCKSLSSLL